MDAVSLVTSEPSQLDEHVDDFCFTVALALRRILGITPPSEEDEDPDDIWEDMTDEQ